MLSPNTRAPHADRLRALAGVLEHVADDRHRHRVEHRAADRLQHPRGDQRSRGSARARTAASRARTPPGRSGTRAGGRAGRRWSRPASAGSRAPACRRRSSTAARRRTRASARWIAGSATFTIVVSSPTISRLMQQIPRISRRLERSGGPWRGSSGRLARHSGPVSSLPVDNTAQPEGPSAVAGNRGVARGSARSRRRSSCRDVSKRYPGQREPAIAELSLEVGAGEVCVLVGPVGVGQDDRDAADQPDDPAQRRATSCSAAAACSTATRTSCAARSAT